MLSPEEDMEATVLHSRGWTISAIARHLGRSRVTVRAYITGKRQPGQRRLNLPKAFDAYAEYAATRLRDDPHVWATALYDEVRRLGYERSYQRFTHELRQRGLRPHCEPCAGVRGRITTDIPHPPGAEIQWDFLELPSPWGPGSLHLLVGALSHSGRTRATFCESEDQAHVIAGIDRVLRKLGGTAAEWRFDRMAAVVYTQTGKPLPTFIAAAKHYGSTIAICPPRRGNRKGVVESRNHFLAQRWWRTAAVADVAEAERDLDRFCAETGDELPRGETTVRVMAEREVLRPLPAAPYPATLTEERIVTRTGRVAYDGNEYAAAPGLVGRRVTVRTLLGSGELQVVTPDGQVVATHRIAAGRGQVIATPDQLQAVELAVLGACSTETPCRRKENRPPSAEALAIAARLGGDVAGAHVVVNLEQYRELAELQETGS
jgi:transposase